MGNRSLILCATCGARVVPLKNGVVVTVPSGSTAKADLYGCETCGYKVLTGFGAWLMPDTAARVRESYAEHYPDEVYVFAD